MRSLRLRPVRLRPTGASSATPHRWLRPTGALLGGGAEPPSTSFGASRVALAGSMEAPDRLHSGSAPEGETLLAAAGFRARKDVGGRRGRCCSSSYSTVQLTVVRTGSVRCSSVVPVKTQRREPGHTTDTHGHGRARGSHRRTSRPSKPTKTPATAARQPNPRPTQQPHLCRSPSSPGAERSPRPTQKRPPPANPTRPPPAPRAPN